MDAVARRFLGINLAQSLLLPVLRILMSSVEVSRQCEFDSYFSCAGSAEQKSNIVA